MMGWILASWPGLCRGHPRLARFATGPKTWMPGTRPGMTEPAALPHVLQPGERLLGNLVAVGDADLVEDARLGEIARDTLTQFVLRGEVGGRAVVAAEHGLLEQPHRLHVILW